MSQEKENFTETIESSEKGASNPELDPILSNGDVALQVIASGKHAPYTSEEEKSLLRKIDLHLMPFMFISYFLQFMDKAALSNSSVFGLIDDLHLVGNQYSWCGSIFYFGYMIGQPIAARCMQHFSIARYVGVSFVMWAIVLVCTTATKNFGGLATIRFLLGMCEATVSPAWILLTGMWYKKTESAMRDSIWYSGNAFGVIFGGLISYGLGHIHSSIVSWKWFYVVYGILSFFWGFALYFCLPDSVVDCKFLNDREKYIAVERLRDSRTGVKNKVFKKEQAFEALLDPQVWLIAIIYFIGCLPAGGVQNFGNLIIESFGFNSFQTVLINMPSGVMQALTLWLSGWIVSRYPNTTILIQSICIIPCLIGTCIVKYLPNHPVSRRNGKLFAFYCIYINTMSDITIFALMQKNISGFTKKSTTNVIFFVCYCVGMIAAPQFFKSSQAPGYSEGFKMMIVCWVILIVLPWVLFYYYYIENKKKVKNEEREIQEGKEALENEEFLDLTDKQQRGFRYTY